MNITRLLVSVDRHLYIFTDSGLLITFPKPLDSSTRRITTQILETFKNIYLKYKKKNYFSARKIWINNVFIFWLYQKKKIIITIEPCKMFYFCIGSIADYLYACTTAESLGANVICDLTEYYWPRRRQGKTKQRSSHRLSRKNFYRGSWVGINVFPIDSEQ